MDAGNEPGTIVILVLRGRLCEATISSKSLFPVSYLMLTFSCVFAVLKLGYPQSISRVCTCLRASHAFTTPLCLSVMVSACARSYMCVWARMPICVCPCACRCAVSTRVQRVNAEGDALRSVQKGGGERERSGGERERRRGGVEDGADIKHSH